MGTTHATLSKDDDGDKETLSSSVTLLLGGGDDEYVVEQRLYPGSGRMMRTYRLKHVPSHALVVAKTLWVSQEYDAEVQQHQAELIRIRQALRGHVHVAPFDYWHIGEYCKAQPSSSSSSSSTSASSSNMIRPIHLLRPHFYTTLSDRLASRPFLSHVEKLWIIYQLLTALQDMHDSGVVHGFVTTENVALTSWNWVVLVDISSLKSKTALPDDDPSEYLQYFQELHHKHGTDTSAPREKRCYLAPERFYTPQQRRRQQEQVQSQDMSTTTLDSGYSSSSTGGLTPAMDMFSTGCVLMETFLNGQRACDLGDLMDYRRNGTLTASMQQGLNKIESSSLRAACRHMLHLDPSQRLSAQDYKERLQNVIPTTTFDNVFVPLFERITCHEVTPDARMAVAASYYGKVLRGTVGIIDKEGEAYFAEVLGPTICRLEEEEAAEDDTSKKYEMTTTTPSTALSDNGNRLNAGDALLAETEALLKKLESPSFDDDDDDELLPTMSSILPIKLPTNENVGAPPSPEAADSLLIYLQLILSTVRSVQRPSSKLVGLQLLERLGSLSSDDSKLQRIVPTTASLLHDQDPLVRASAVHVMTVTLSTIKTFAPSDSKIFPQYIFKRVAHLNSDPSLVVRITFARCIASLADTAHRFLDISHAVRLYEAVGSGNGSDETDLKSDGALTPGVFTDDVASLLDDKQREKKPSENLEETDSASMEPVHSRKSSIGNASATTSSVGRTLISSTYASELAALQEIVSRWVVHIATDQSDQSSPPKRSLLRDLARLCNFFGRDGVMGFILPQILAFLNDRRDWQLRADLFIRLPSVCSIIGRAATEHFVLPCLETALVDAEDQVMSRALSCLSSLVEMGLLSRSVLVAPQSVLPLTGISGKPKRGLFEKYLPLLVYPCSNVRQSIVAFVTASCRSLGFPDAFVFLLPLLRPYLRFEPSTSHLTTGSGLESCLVLPWTQAKLNVELERIAHRSHDANLGTQWTSVDTTVEEIRRETKQEAVDESKNDIASSSAGASGLMNTCMVEYLAMLQRSRRTNAPGSERLNESRGGGMAIEGSLKLAQQVRFPDQNVAGSASVCIPWWYTALRDGLNEDELSSEEVGAVHSVMSLSQVYGLSLIEDPTIATSRVSKDAVVVEDEPHSILKEEAMRQDFDASTMNAKEADVLRGAIAGEWGSDVRVDPSNTDTALLVTKMKGLEVPLLPPNIGVVYKHDILTTERRREAAGDSKIGGDWKQRTDALIASSSFAGGHSGPVSRLAVAPDERYFVSASYDGVLKVWETRQAQDSDGTLSSSATYSGHLDGAERGHPRINDVATLKNYESVVSGASDGSLHIWRVDKVSSTSSAICTSQNVSLALRSRHPDYVGSRVSGCTSIHKTTQEEGEIHAVSHFNTHSASVVVFATQSLVHSIDLRQTKEPFHLKHQPDTGYLSSMAVGNDGNWVVTGTSRGFVALWDVRFRQMVKLWQHSSHCQVARLATSFVSFPKKRGERRAPAILVACGQNEFGMFDAMTGTCHECFRVVGPRTRMLDPLPDHDLQTSMPALRQIDLSTSRKPLCDFSQYAPRIDAMGPSINSFVGNVGGSDHSSMITGGDDGYIRYWDFATPSKCFTISGHQGFHHRPTFERIDHDGHRLMLCRQGPAPRHNDVDSSRFPRMAERRHTDSVMDVKLLNFPERMIISCSRDATVKLWR